MSAMRCWHAGLFAALALGACVAQPINHQQGAVSPSGRFVVRVPIERSASVDPKYHGLRVWTVSIGDRAGRMLYRDLLSTFAGTRDVYWGWDQQDRVWLYDSDNGRIWLWEIDGGRWQKRAATRAEGMPAFVLPDDAK
jgi:hypothetical protein